MNVGELKPCPWCGSNAEHGDMDNGCPIICCSNKSCEVIGPNGNNILERMKAWNTRKGTTITYETLGEVRRLLSEIQYCFSHGLEIQPGSALARAIPIVLAKLEAK